MLCCSQTDINYKVRKICNALYIFSKSITFNNPIKAYFFTFMIQTHKLKPVNLLFNYIGVQNQLPISFGIALVSNMISKKKKER